MPLFRPAGGMLVTLGVTGLLDPFVRFVLEGVGTPAFAARRPAARSLECGHLQHNASAIEQIQLEFYESARCVGFRSYTPFLPTLGRRFLGDGAALIISSRK